MAWLFDRYQPQPEWFAHDPLGNHGISHVGRVLVWAGQIADAMQAQGRPVDAQVVYCAAVTHDVGRYNDRSASWTPAGVRAAATPGSGCARPRWR